MLNHRQAIGLHIDGFDRIGSMTGRPASCARSSREIFSLMSGPRQDCFAFALAWKKRCSVTSWQQATGQTAIQQLRLGVAPTAAETDAAVVSARDHLGGNAVPVPSPGCELHAPPESFHLGNELQFSLVRANRVHFTVKGPDGDVLDHADVSTAGSGPALSARDLARQQELPGNYHPTLRSIPHGRAPSAPTAGPLRRSCASPTPAWPTPMAPPADARRDGQRRVDPARLPE